MVIGGGNAAIDAARTALRLGAEEVTVVYRRTRDEMPAYAEEVEEAEQEGVQFEFLAAPQEIVGGEGGKVAGVQCRRMELGEFDRSGRRRPDGEGRRASSSLEADQVIAAIGQALDADGARRRGGAEAQRAASSSRSNPVTGPDLGAVGLRGRRRGRRARPR